MRQPQRSPSTTGELGEQLCTKSGSVRFFLSFVIHGVCCSSLHRVVPYMSQTCDVYNYCLLRYPVAIVEDLEPNEPTRVELLGEGLVLWRDKDEQWRAATDRCSHRWAPLSEGLIDPITKRLTVSAVDVVNCIKQKPISLHAYLLC
jgi:Rieske [2Fe-2S] domain